MSTCGRRAGSGIATTSTSSLLADGAAGVRARTASRGARLLAAAVACIACSLLAPLAATAATGPEDGRPQRDVRDDSATVSAAQAKDRAALDAKLGDESVVKADGVTGGLRVVARTDGLLTAASGDDPADIALNYVRAHGKAFGLGSGDLSSLRLIGRSRSVDGVTHLAWAQTVGGIASYDGVLLANVTSDGRLVNVSAPLVSDLSVNTSAPALSASDALAIAKRDARGALQMPSSSGGSGAERATTFSNGDTARLVAFASKASSRLAWSIKVAGEVPFVYDTVVDAASGAILARDSLMDFLRERERHRELPRRAARRRRHDAGSRRSRRHLAGPLGRRHEARRQQRPHLRGHQQQRHRGPDRGGPVQWWRQLRLPPHDVRPRRLYVRRRGLLVGSLLPGDEDHQPEPGHDAAALPHQPLPRLAAACADQLRRGLAQLRERPHHGGSGRG